MRRGKIEEERGYKREAGRLSERRGDTSSFNPIPHSAT